MIIHHDLEEPEDMDNRKERSSMDFIQAYHILSAILASQVNDTHVRVRYMDLLLNGCGIQHDKTEFTSDIAGS